MDYKFIILLLVIVGLILFFTRELDNMKCEMSDKLDKIASYVDNSSKNTLIKMQNGFGTCVNKLKTLNGDYIEQVRKMNDYGNQPITNMSNHYTDTDSRGNGMKFAALSDCRENQYVQIPTKFNDQELYISEQEPRRVKKTSDQFKIILPHSEKSSKQLEGKKANLDLIDDENNHITTESTNSEKKSVKTTPPNDNQENDSDYVDDVENIEDEENKFEAKEYGFGDIDENDIEDSDEEEEVSVEKGDSEHSSNYDSITFGSRRKTESKNKNVDNDSMQELTIGNLQSKDMYTSEVLKKIAKNLAIPISHKEGSVRRQLRKDELYDKIKCHLSGKK